MIPPGAPHNPFSVTRVAPGAIPFVAIRGTGIAALLTRFERDGRWGQIVGPEGTGKSTLRAHLAGATRAAGRPVLEIRVDRPGAPAPPAALAGGVLCIEGVDALSGWARRRLFRRCRRLGIGVLVTTHQNVGLPTLWRAAADLPTLRRIVSHLLDGWDVPPPADDELAALLARHAGDVRSVLFALYDWYEAIYSPLGRTS